MGGQELARRGRVRSSRGFTLAFTLAAVLALTTAGSVAAADRYASPSGTGSELGPCPQSDPCSLPAAVSGADPGDRILVLDGTYPLASTLFVNAKRLVATGPGRPLLTGSGIRLISASAGSVLRGLDVNAANPGGSLPTVTATTETLLERMKVHASGNAVAALAIHQSEIRNSLVTRARDDSPAGAALLGGATVVRNVTALELGTGGGSGVAMTGSYSTPGGGTMVLVNSIARSASGPDVRVNDDTSDDIVVRARNSSFDMVSLTPPNPALLIDDGGNQVRPPLLAPSGAQLAASPTIDSGRTAAARGTLDLAGAPRISGPAVDIGAFERISNRLRFLRLVRNTRRGTARLRVDVAGPGRVLLRRSAALRPARARTQAPGVANLQVRPRGRALRRLNRSGRVRVALRVTFNPDGGSPRTRTKRVVLRKR